MTDSVTGAVDEKRIVVREGERHRVATKGHLYSYHYEELAYKKAGKNMEPYTITPSFGEETVFSHEGEEFIYVLEGTHEFVYGEETYVLKAGDSAYFDSAVPHSRRSIGPKKAKVLAVLYSYERHYSALQKSLPIWNRQVFTIIGDRLCVIDTSFCKTP